MRSSVETGLTVLGYAALLMLLSAPVVLLWLLADDHSEWWHDNYGYDWNWWQSIWRVAVPAAMFFAGCIVHQIAENGLREWRNAEESLDQWTNIYNRERALTEHLHGEIERLQSGRTETE